MSRVVTAAMVAATARDATATASASTTIHAEGAINAWHGLIYRHVLDWLGSQTCSIIAIELASFAAAAQPRNQPPRSSGKQPARSNTARTAGLAWTGNQRTLAAAAKYAAASDA